MAAITTTGTLTAGNSRTFALAPGSALTLTLLPNCRVTVTETPETVSASDAGGNSPRTHNHQLAGVVTYGPYAMGGSVVVDNASNSGSTVTWGRKDTTVSTSSDGTSLVSGDGILGVEVALFRSYGQVAAHTGTTSETKLASFRIPAGTIVTPAALRILTGMQYTTTADAGNRTLRYYLNTSDAIGGTVLCSNVMSTQSVTQGVNGRLDQIIFPTDATQSGAAVGAGWNSTQGNAWSSATYNVTTQDLWLVVTSQLINASDSFTLKSLEVFLSNGA